MTKVFTIFTLLMLINILTIISGFYYLDYTRREMVDLRIKLERTQADYSILEDELSKCE